jgi:hypothetical protein
MSAFESSFHPMSERKAGLFLPAMWSHHNPIRVRVLQLPFSSTWTRSLAHCIAWLEFGGGSLRAGEMRTRQGQRAAADNGDYRMRFSHLSFRVSLPVWGEVMRWDGRIRSSVCLIEVCYVAVRFAKDGMAWSRAKCAS